MTKSLPEFILEVFILANDASIESKKQEEMKKNEEEKGKLDREKKKEQERG